MDRIIAHFDGKAFVPHAPVQLAPGQVVELEVISSAARHVLAQLADFAETLPEIENSPRDGAAQHDHYLYGHPKRP